MENTFPIGTTLLLMLGLSGRVISCWSRIDDKSTWYRCRTSGGMMFTTPECAIIEAHADQSH